MNANKWLTACLIAVFMFVAFAPLAQAAPGNGPGERDANGGADRPNMAHQGHRWGDPDPVNPPNGGQPATNFVAGTATTLAVTVFADANANSIRDEGEVVLEGVYVALETTKGVSVRPGIKTDVYGRVLFLGLAEGEYMVVVLPAENFQSAKAPVEVFTGETTEVEVGLKPASTGG